MKKLLLSLVCVLGLLGGLRAQEAETITIGSGDATINYSPTYVYNYYTVSQQIFVADEMQEKSGKITSFAFMLKPKDENNVNWGAGTTRTFKIYMVNTDKTSFENTTDWVTVTENDLVFDGSVTFVTPGQWTVVNFTTPFIYKKGKNVLLCVNDVTGTFQAEVPKYASEGRSEKRMIYKGSDAKVLATNLSSVTGTLKEDVNQVQFTIVDDGSGEELDPAPNAPAHLKAEALSDTEIQLTWDAVEGATYNVYQKDVEEAITKGLATTTYTVANLTPGTNYCFTVTAAKDLESEKSEEACAETKSRATTFAFDFNDGIVDMRVFQGAGASHLAPGWASPKDYPLGDMVEGVKNYYKGVDGTMAVYSLTYFVDTPDEIYTPDNYIVTEKPYLITATSTIEWDIRQAETGKTDQYALVVSEDGTNFTDIWFERYSDKTGETKAYSLAAYAGKEIYIGFHHYKQTDGGALCLDNVKLVIDSQVTPETPVDTTAPTIPDNVKAVAFSSSTIKLTWNASENTTSYNIYSGDNLVVTSITETSYMVEDLEAGTQYCFTVTAVNGEKESDKSTEVCATTKKLTPDTPDAPKNLKAEALTVSTIQLTWDAVDGAKVYNVYQGVVKLLSVSETTHIATSLQAGREYCFTVTAVNDGGESAKSEQACATTLVEEGVEKPATPQNFTVKAIVPGELQLSWDAVDNADEYNIYEGEDLLGTVNKTIVDMTGLESEKEYCFTVTALNKGGESAKSEEACETTLEYTEPVAPAVPQNLTVEAVTYNELRLSWDAVEDATKYRVYQFGELLGEITQTTCDIYDLADSTQYCFTVTAVNSAGESEESEEACGKTWSESIEELTSLFNIYPNPVNDKLYIETLTQTQTLTVEIYDVYGRQQSMVNGQQSMVIDVTNLNSGIYFVKIVTNDGEAVKRFVKK